MKHRLFYYEDGLFMLWVRARSVHPQCLSVQSRWQVSEASSPGCWVDHQIVKCLGFDSCMGQWQVSITSTPPSSTLTLCSSRSKALAAFFCLFLPPVVEDGREGGTTQALCPAGMHQSWGGRLKPQGGCSRQRRGWKLCQGRMPRVTQRYEAPLYGVPPCPRHEPSPGPISYSPLWNQTLQSTERKSMVRNNLTVCHRGMLLPTRVEEVCSRVYRVCVSLSLPLYLCVYLL